MGRRHLEWPRTSGRRFAPHPWWRGQRPGEGDPTVSVDLDAVRGTAGAHRAPRAPTNCGRTRGRATWSRGCRPSPGARSSRRRRGCCSSSGSGSRSLAARSPSRSGGGSVARPSPGTATARRAIIEADAVDVITVGDITDADARAGGHPMWRHWWPTCAARRTSISTGSASTSWTSRTRARARGRRGSRTTTGPRSTGASTASTEPAPTAPGPGRCSGSSSRCPRPCRGPGRCGRRERLPFKADVRKLKNLGLTISLGVGYELSPRGQAYLDG